MPRSSGASSRSSSASRRVEDTIAILRGLKPRYEAHHKGVKIKDSALVAAAELSHRYITDRFLPDKAIDLVDEATSRLAMELQSVPTEIDEVQRRLMQLELAARQLAEETEEHAQERLAEIEDEMAELRKQAGQPARAVGSREAGRRRRGQTCATELRRSASSSSSSSATTIKEQAVGRPVGRREAVPAAVRARSASGKQAREAARRSRSQASDGDEADGKPATGRRLLRQEVGPEEIAEVVSAWTGIPVTRMLETETAKLLVLEERLHQRVVGQDEAVEAVANAVRRSRSGSARSESADRLVHLPAARPASARPSSARRSPRCCSTTRTRWSAST